MGKKRVSLTIDEDTVESLAERAQMKDLNRSEMVGEILEDYMSQEEIRTAVILAGDSERKALEEYKGRTVIEHVLERVSSIVDRLIILTGNNREEIESRLGSEFDGSAVEYVSEKPKGTAAAVRNIRKKVEGTFIVMNGHVITDIDFREMIRTHRDAERIATMALTTVEDPSNYGVARMKGRKILGFVEKPEPEEEPSRLINAGTYIMDEEIFDEIEGDSLEKGFRKLASASELTGYIYGGEWIDVSEQDL